MEQNHINYTLECARASTERFSQWAETVPHINVLHIDIQGAEEKFFQDRTVLRIMEEKVKRAIIGTHGSRVHNEIKMIFSNWIVQYELPREEDQVVVRAMSLFRRRSQGQIVRSNLEQIIREKLFFNSLYGKIVVVDGEIVIDNPHLSSPSKSRLFK